MAKVVKEMPLRQGHTPEKYPWAKWLDGQIWALTEFEDFDCASKNFVVQCHNTAKLRYNCRVETRTIGNIVYVQAYDHGRR